MNNATLTESMKRALILADRNGAVFAGAGNAIEPGRLITVYAPVMYALERRDCLKLSIGPDGGMMGKITDRGRSALLGTAPSIAFAA